MKQGRETTLEERIQIIRECTACGKNYGEMALKYRVSYQQVRSWTLRFEQMGETGRRIVAVAARKTRRPVPNWSKLKLKLSSSNISCICALLKKIGRDRDERCLSEAR